MSLKKRGLSDVIATVSLILLAVAAIGIISSFIIPFVRNNLEESSSCLDYRDYFTFDDGFGYNCYRDGLYAVSIRAGGSKEADVKGIKLVFTDATGESRSVSIEENSADFGRNEGKIRRVNVSLPIDVPKGGEVRTYIYNSSSTFDVVDIFPFLESEKICDKTDSIKISGEICNGVLTQ